MGAQPLHVTHADTRPPTETEKGVWVATCLFSGCGWNKRGEYRHAGAEPVALSLAHAYGTEHEHRMNKVHAPRRTS